MHLWEAFAARYRDSHGSRATTSSTSPPIPGGDGRRAFPRAARRRRPGDRPRPHRLRRRQPYSTDFSIFARALRERRLRLPRLRARRHGVRRPVPRGAQGESIDRDALEEKFLERTRIQRSRARRSGSASSARSTPATPSSTRSATRSSPTSSRSTTPTAPGWSIWTYKDVGPQGLVHAAPESAYLRRFGALIARRRAWGSTPGARPTRRCPRSSSRSTSSSPASSRAGRPTRGARARTTDDLVRHVLFAQAMLTEYAERFRDLGDDDLDELADSFALARCVTRTRLCELCWPRAPARRPGGLTTTPRRETSCPGPNSPDEHRPVGEPSS